AAATAPSRRSIAGSVLGTRSHGLPSETFARHRLRPSSLGLMPPLADVQPPRFRFVLLNAAWPGQLAGNREEARKFGAFAAREEARESDGRGDEGRHRGDVGQGRDVDHGFAPVPTEPRLTPGSTAIGFSTSRPSL